jgi:hypothetical protein
MYGNHEQDYSLQRTFPIRGGEIGCRRVGAIKGPARDYDMKIG